MYELINTGYSAERTNSPEKYEITITLGLHPTDGVAPDFAKDIVVISDNGQSGYEVDAQRIQAIKNFMLSIN